VVFKASVLGTLTARRRRSKGRKEKRRARGGGGAGAEGEYEEEEREAEEMEEVVFPVTLDLIMYNCYMTTHRDLCLASSTAIITKDPTSYIRQHRVAQCRE